MVTGFSVGISQGAEPGRSSRVRERWALDVGYEHVPEPATKAQVDHLRGNFDARLNKKDTGTLLQVQGMLQDAQRIPIGPRQKSRGGTVGRAPLGDRTHRPVAPLCQRRTCVRATPAKWPPRSGISTGYTTLRPGSIGW